MKSDRSRREATGRHHGLCCSVRGKGQGSDEAGRGNELSNRCAPGVGCNSSIFPRPERPGRRAKPSQ